MAPSKVYFTDLRTHNSISLPEKLKKLIRKAGIADIMGMLYYYKQNLFVVLLLRS